MRGAAVSPAGEATNEFIADFLYRKYGNLVNSDLSRDYDTEEVHRAPAKKVETLKHLWKKVLVVGSLHSELLYIQDFNSYELFMDDLIDNLDYYNNFRIKQKTNGSDTCTAQIPDP